MSAARPLVVQADHTVLVEVRHPRFEEARVRLQRFAELRKSPEFVHFYRITPISVWNAANLGERIEDIVEWLVSASRYPIDDAIVADLREWYSRHGAVRFEVEEGTDSLCLVARDAALLEKLAGSRSLAPFLEADGAPNRARFRPENRGVLKHVLIKLGYPVQDEAGYVAGGALRFALHDVAAGGSFALRRYQERAVAAFHAGGSRAGGCGVIVLPCGAGKTLVGIAAMQAIGAHTLVLTANTVAVRQWRRELLARTTLTEDDVGEYTGESKSVRPVTIATYQILTYRRRREDPFEHFALFERGDWGLIVYDEVHLLPAPVFRATAAIQGRRRLGLTATLVREDGCEGDVFSLIGPKRFELGWRELERDGHLAAARCVEVRVALEPAREHAYRTAGARARARLASTNPAKLDVLGVLLERHADDRVLVIGQYLDQVAEIAARFGLPAIVGRTPTRERDRLYADFRSGITRRLLVSKVGNFAIDLPEANVAIQVSGTFGSRQEEAQRLGRVLRPKLEGGGAVFYSLVSAATCDEDFSARRQLFLAEQGYSYEIVAADAIARGGGPP